MCTLVFLDGSSAHRYRNGNNCTKLSKIHCRGWGGPGGGGRLSLSPSGGLVVVLVSQTWAVMVWASFVRHSTLQAKHNGIL
eukprot:scaffold913_cov186-Alexandrium_tamarense.AAC.7